MTVRLIEWFLVRKIEASGGYQCCPSTIQRLAQLRAGPPIHTSKRVALNQQPVLQLEIGKMRQRLTSANP